MLGVRREGYYDWKKRPARADRDAETVSALKQLRQQHPCYGVRSLREELPEGQRPSYGKCYRLCKENDLLSDITQINCADGKLYLAAIMDCFDGAIVGLSMNTHMRASLCSDALRDAIIRYGYTLNMILHSDHGSQYTSWEYRELIAQYGSIRQSMGRTHCCFDNARMESFFATLKKELIYRLPCASMPREQVRQLIFRWIETYYNRLRRNTANEDNLPPLVKRMLWYKKQGQAA